MLAEFESGLRVGILLASLRLAKPHVQKAWQVEPLNSNPSSATSGLCNTKQATDPSEPGLCLMCDKCGERRTGSREY